MDNTKNSGIQRRWLVPPGVRRVVKTDFPKLDAPLEEGMVSKTPGCLECTLQSIHCTYGAGVRNNGRSRDINKGKCDYCNFTTRKCLGNGFEGYNKDSVGAHSELMNVLRRLQAQVETCIRAGNEDRSAHINAAAIRAKITEVRERLDILSARLGSSSAQARGSGSGRQETIVID